MTQSDFTISRFRRMTNEPSETPYTNSIISLYIEACPVIDVNGKEQGETDWIPTYDINKAAADVWEEKAAAVQTFYDFQADGGRYTQSQLFDMAMEKVRYYRARQRAAVKSVFKSPAENSTEEVSDGLIYDVAYAWWRV